MVEELTEEQMRRALFGGVGSTVPGAQPAANATKERKTMRSRLRVTLRVGNEYEGKLFDYVHDADALSTRLAEQEATKAARKKYQFIELGWG
ncbi:hypothetical protein [Pseudomonas huaxiensis]|uniref:hypothetical protein n=1 Tax=Pseudomonas huaxiensis TaxID=2213017 RepID=UPI000DA6D554|nr:hypothetical protein [Pseudomonas huaxiensis]